jgi:CRISPR/Cas system-associated exonuclease Cas4 (RecB family)
VHEALRQYLNRLLQDIAATDPQVVLLVILLVAIVIVLDAISLFARKQRKKLGIEDKSPEVTIHGTRSLPPRLYVSDIQGLSGKPDAIISENGCIIPVERKPLARKIRDRHVAQLLVYMRLVEEFEGKKPPYGYLVLGANCRRVKIPNSDEKQAWLQKMIDEMRAIFTSAQAAVPAPHPRKCRKCNVRNACGHRVENPEEPR